MLTYDEWYDSISGHSPQKGDQDAADAIMMHFQLLDEKGALNLYKFSNAWPPRVPFALMKLAISSFALGDNKYFDLVFVENDTHMSVDGLECLMGYIESEIPWLKWTQLVDWKKLSKHGKDHLLNPIFLKSLYKFDPNVRRDYEIKHNLRRTS